MWNVAVIKVHYVLLANFCWKRAFGGGKWPFRGMAISVRQWP